MTTSKSLFLIKGAIFVFIICYLGLTIVDMAMVNVKYIIHDETSNLSQPYQEKVSVVEANIDNATNPAFVFATSLLCSILSTVVVGIPLYNLRVGAGA